MQAEHREEGGGTRHVRRVDRGGRTAGSRDHRLQEIFFGPYFCAEQDPKWLQTAEPADGPTVATMRELARRHEMVLVVPFFEKELEGVFYDTTVVIDADGTVLGKYRKTHIPQVGPIFWEKYFFKPGNLGYPVFETRGAYDLAVLPRPAARDVREAVRAPAVGLRPPARDCGSTSSPARLRNAPATGRTAS